MFLFEGEHSRAGCALRGGYTWGRRAPHHAEMSRAHAHMLSDASEAAAPESRRQEAGDR